jgi:hypothetical protein
MKRLATLTGGDLSALKRQHDECPAICAFQKAFRFSCICQLPVQLRRSPPYPPFFSHHLHPFSCTYQRDLLLAHSFTWMYYHYFLTICAIRQPPIPFSCWTGQPNARDTPSTDAPCIWPPGPIQQMCLSRPPWISRLWLFLLLLQLLRCCSFL